MPHCPHDQCPQSRDVFFRKQMMPPIMPYQNVCTDRVAEPGAASVLASAASTTIRDVPGAITPRPRDGCASQPNYPKLSHHGPPELLPNQKALRVHRASAAGNLDGEGTFSQLTASELNSPSFQAKRNHRCTSAPALGGTPGVCLVTFQ